MATTTTLDGFPTLPSGASVLGEVINWEMNGVTVPFAQVRAALDTSGLGKEWAKEMLPKNGFARAVRKLAADRLVEQIGETETHVRFQYTNRRDAETERQYVKDAVVELDKSTLDVTGDDPDLAREVKALFDEQVGLRNAGDITALIKRVFTDKRKADLDLVPMSSYANFYFVRASRLDFVNQVNAFIDAVGGRMLRLPIAGGTPQGDTGVKDAVASKMASLIAEYRDAVAEFGRDTRDATLRAAAERVKILRYKIESYAAYLDDRKDTLKSDLDEATRELKARVAAIGAERAAAEQPAAAAS